MRLINQNAMTEGKHYFDGSCAPKAGFGCSGMQTFSVGIFQAVLTAKGDRCKRGPTLYRVKGSTSWPEKVFERATEICRLMDMGRWKSKKKSEVVR